MIVKEEMVAKEEMNSIKRTARTAGLLYLLAFPFSIFNLIVNSSLIVPGDAAATANNIMASEGLFRSSIVSWLIGQTIFVVLPLVLYQLFKPVNKNHALLMVLLILLAIPIAFINELNNFAALLLLSGADYLTAIEADQLLAQMMMYLDFRELGINIASIFWGLWLFPLGYLIFKSGFLPRIIGIILIIAGFGYLIDFAIFALFPNFEMSVGQITGFGELLLPSWLLIKGVNVEQWEKRALETVHV